MATVLTIGTDALAQIGVLGEDETMSASQGAIVLRYFQRQIDAWGADNLTFSTQLRTQFTLTSGTSTVTLGPSPATVVMARPLDINQLNFIIPGTSPAVESPIALMDDDGYAALSIKLLSSALPTQAYYQRDIDTVNGELFIWPRVSQNVEIVIYSPQAVGVPLALTTDVIGPPGYAEAFVDQLSLRLCQPFAVPPTQLLVELAAKSWANMKRPNVQPGVLGVDPALTGGSNAGSYNVLTDQ